MNDKCLNCLVKEATKPLDTLIRVLSYFAVFCITGLFFMYALPLVQEYDCEKHGSVKIGGHTLICEVKK